MTPTPVLSDERGLLAAILANPDEDTPRLMYADYLDERDTVRVKCLKCKGDGGTSTPDYDGGLCDKFWDSCPTCKGTGTTPDTESGVRAELLRVQIEWNSLKAISQPNTNEGRAETRRILDLGSRVEELLTTHRAVLFPVCRQCDGTGEPMLDGYPPLKCSCCSGSGVAGAFDGRGLITEVRVPSIESVLVETDVPCQRCKGHGEVIDYPESKFGTPKYKTCPQCLGRRRQRDLQPSDYARELFRRCPALACVAPVDRVPSTLNDSTELHWFANENDWPHGVSEISGSHKLPWLVAMRLRHSARTSDCRNSWEQATYLQRMWYYDSLELALSALGTALCYVLREMLTLEVK